VNGHPEKDLSDIELETQLRTGEPLYCLQFRPLDNARRMLRLMVAKDPGHHQRASLELLIREREAEHAEAIQERERAEALARDKANDALAHHSLRAAWWGVALAVVALAVSVVAYLFPR
jgi:hypothetical protein